MLLYHCNGMLTFHDERPFGSDLIALHCNLAHILGCCVVNNESVGAGDVLELEPLSNRQWLVVFKPSDFAVWSVHLACEGSVLRNFRQHDAVQRRDQRQIVICNSYRRKVNIFMT